MPARCRLAIGGFYLAATAPKSSNRSAWVLLCTMLVSAAAAAPEDCEQLRQILALAVSEPRSLAAERIEGNRTKALVQPPNTHVCLFEESEDYLGVDCIWVAQSFPNGQRIYAGVRSIMAGCPFVDRIEERMEASGSARGRVRLRPSVGPDGALSVTLWHDRALEFSDRGAREITLSVRADKQR